MVQTVSAAHLVTLVFLLVGIPVQGAPAEWPQSVGASGQLHEVVTNPVDSLRVAWKKAELVGDGRYTRDIEPARYVVQSASDVPVVTTPPANVIRWPADDPRYEGAATFTCEFISNTDPVVNWYKQGEGSTPLTGTLEELGGGVYSSTLTVANITIACEGSYLCTITNATGTIAAGPVDLGMRRLVGYWKLDSISPDTSYPDELGLHPAWPNNVPVSTQFVDGIEGQALDLVPEPKSAAATAEWAVPAYTGEFSASVWVNWGGDNGWWQGIVSNRLANTAPARNFTIEINPNTGDLQLFTGDTFRGGPLIPGEWTHVAVTAGPSGRAIYLNGTLVTSATASGVMLGQNSVPLMIGDIDPPLLSPFNGVLDDVKLYNYVLGAVDVAVEYTGLSGETVCAASMPADYNGDCRVDLLDLTIALDFWLECGLYPSCVTLP